MNIIFENIRYAFPNPSPRSLHDISFNLNISDGDIIGLVGKSGSGKSTILEIIAGLRRPFAGSLLVDGLNLYEHANRKIFIDYKNRVSYVKQSTYIEVASVRHNIELLASLTNQKYPKISLQQAVDIACIPTNQSISYHLDSLVCDSASNISGGQKQRIGIARGLYKNHDLLLLDEATSALDSETEERIIRQLASMEASRTIVMSAHKYSALKICSKIYVVQDGSIAQEYSGESLRHFLGH
jgi:ABC-type bacteriocin/lantibiotic exporter with double-glycine peptidase domain